MTSAQIKERLEENRKNRSGPRTLTDLAEDAGIRYATLRMALHRGRLSLTLQDKIAKVLQGLEADLEHAPFPDTSSEEGGSGQ